MKLGQLTSHPEFVVKRKVPKPMPEVEPRLSKFRMIRIALAPAFYVGDRSLTGQLSTKEPYSEEWDITPCSPLKVN
jgi:hypothetical protein